MCECPLGLFKWQMPFQSQQREVVAPVCGCALACVELGRFPTDELVGDGHGWAAGIAVLILRSETGMFGSHGDAE